MVDQFTHGYALLVGVDENKVPRWALPDVAKDIDALRRVLTHPERCAYPVDNVKVLQGREATQAGILNGLDWLRGRIQADPEATAAIYYSGHGWRDTAAVPAQFYLIPYDVREGRLRFTALRAADLADQIAALNPPRLLVVLDCCHAAGMGVKGPSLQRAGERTEVRDMLPVGYVPAAVAPSLLIGEEGFSAQSIAAPGAKGFEALAEGHGRAVLSSSSGEQSSYIRRDGRMSVFTWHLIEALIGHAQPKEGAAHVLVSDVMSYVWRRVPETVRREQGQVQTPDFRVSGNFPVALLLGGKGLSEGTQPPDPLAGIGDPVPRQPPPTIDTGGGMLVGGNLINQGEIVGRDQYVSGDVVHGDKIAGDKITAGAIHDNVGVTLGRGSRLAVTQTQGLGGDELAQLFSAVYSRIDARSSDPNVDKDELTETVQKIEQEVKRGEGANPTKVERWLGFLAAMAGDIFDVVVACLSSPAAGVAAVIRNVAQRAKQDAEKRS